MRKVYHLSTCNTCQRIIKEVNLPEDFVSQNIKTEKITEQQLDEMKELAGNYKALFSKIAMKYKSLGLKNKQLSEQDYKQYILDEYTFLKRPIFILDDEIFVGNSKKNIASLTEKIASL